MLLLRILAHHPEVTRITASARTTAGMPMAEADPGLPHSIVRRGAVDSTVLAPEEALADPGDIVFSALPHGASAEVCAPVLGSVPVIDLSADFRFSNPHRFETAYGNPPPAPEFQARSVYGLCEWNRDRIPSAAVIANPGCYPTATLLPVLPAAAAGLVEGPLVVNAISGISGAGRKAKQNLLLAERTENANAYSVGTQHRHQAEIVEQLLAVSRTVDAEPVVVFNPHLAPIKQGMVVTTVLPTSHPAAVVEAIRERYQREQFIELTGESAPETRHVRGSNRIRIGWRVERNHVILLSVIDNLWKGASGQAVQNMNIYFGFPEESGLDHGMEL
jgi:N-acetyl-gamma-glutamyl-phosphate reductase